MKKIDVALWELKYSEVKQLPRGTEVLQMDVRFGGYSVKCVGSDFISSNLLRYKWFAFDEQKI